MGRGRRLRWGCSWGWLGWAGALADAAPGAAAVAAGDEEAEDARG